MPPAATKSNMAKISKFYILTPPRPQGHVMSVKCEQPLDELTVQVWLLYDHPNFKYCTLLVSGTELRTDKRTDRRTIRLLDAPRRTFQAGGIKIWQRSRSPFDPPHPQGHGMLVKCEEPIDELTVPVWLLYHHPNFKYCTL